MDSKLKVEVTYLWPGEKIPRAEARGIALCIPVGIAPRRPYRSRPVCRRAGRMGFIVHVAFIAARYFND